MTTGTDRGAAADETRKAMPETRLPKAPKVTKWGGRAARERGRLPLLPACIPVEKRGAEKRRSVQGSPNKGVETGEIGERLRERRDVLPSALEDVACASVDHASAIEKPSLQSQQSNVQCQMDATAGASQSTQQDERDPARGYEGQQGLLPHRTLRNRRSGTTELKQRQAQSTSAMPSIRTTSAAVST